MKMECPKSTKLSSVKKLFFICLVPWVQELYQNIKSILQELKLEGMEYGISADIKIYLILCGKQTASCLHPCPYCEGVAPWNRDYEDLTIGSLNNWYQKFIRSNNNKNNAKKYQNVINPPLLVGDDATKTLKILYNLNFTA